MTEDLRERLNRVCPAGIILFARNLLEAAQVARLCRDLARSLPVVPFLAIDQEGGRVNRLKGIFPVIPPNLSLSAAQSPEELVREHARQTGRGLRLLGFSLNFAPVLDLSDESMPTGIGDRAYGSEPEIVARLARIFLDFQAAEGVLGCGKHFPGLGGARVDSHLELPVIEKSADRLWDEDLAPYRALRGECPMVMVGHAHYPALQGGDPRPATLSRAVVSELLRDRIGYRGVVLTDDLEMGAVDQARSPGDVVLEALEAGNDLVMYCKSWDRVEEAHAALSRAIRNGRIPPARAEDSLARIFSLKNRLEAVGPSFDPRRLEEVCRSLHLLEARTRG